MTLVALDLFHVHRREVGEVGADAQVAISCVLVGAGAGVPGVDPTRSIVPAVGVAGEDAGCLRLTVAVGTGVGGVYRGILPAATSLAAMAGNIVTCLGCRLVCRIGTVSNILEDYVDRAIGMV